MRRSRLVILSVIAMVVVLTVGAISIGGSAGRVLGADDKQGYFILNLGLVWYNPTRL